MSTAFRRGLPVTLVSLTLALLLAGPLAAQSPDPLADVRARRAVEAQRFEQEINDARNAAYRRPPSRALLRLQDLLAKVEKDNLLEPQKRKTLIGTLERDVSALQALARVRRTAGVPARVLQSDARQLPDPRTTADRRSAYDTAASRIRSMQGRVADARDLRGQTSDRFSGVIAQIDKSAAAPVDDYVLPPDWLEKSKKRSPEAKLTARERDILKALKKPVSVDFNMDTFSSVIEYLSKAMGQTILVDKQALEEAGVTYDSPITLRFPRAVSARTALKRVLADVGLTYIIRKENIEVTTIARARETLTTRTYYIGDLLGITNPMLPAIVNDYQAIQAIGMIINSVQGIDPESWEGRGGPGTITYDPIRMTLIVKQTAEMHYMLGMGH